uniref:Uncharacterized protein n=1 Tax=Populus trichocarpa TaxID=3694 RepID=U7E0D9_POPTR
MEMGEVAYGVEAEISTGEAGEERTDLQLLWGTMTVGLREERSDGAETAKGGPWLCVVGWKRKRRWGTVCRLSGEAAVLGQSFVFKGGSNGLSRSEAREGAV